MKKRILGHGTELWKRLSRKFEMEEGNRSGMKQRHPNRLVVADYNRQLNRSGKHPAQ